MARIQIRKSRVEAAARRIRRLSKPGTPERLFTIMEVQHDAALTKPERAALGDLLLRLSNDSQAYGRTGGKAKRVKPSAGAAQKQTTETKP